MVSDHDETSPPILAHFQAFANNFVEGTGAAASCRVVNRIVNRLPAGRCFGYPAPMQQQRPTYRTPQQQPQRVPKAKKKRGCFGKLLILLLVLAALFLVITLVFNALTRLFGNPDEYMDQSSMSQAGNTSMSVAERQNSYDTPFHWAGATWENNRIVYYNGGRCRSLAGIDVSDHQGWIDWSQVANDGIEFAMIRLGSRGYTYGDLYTDEQAVNNLAGASAAGLKTGAYFFSQATTVEEAKAEADLALSILGGRWLDFPVAYDHEIIGADNARADDLDTETISACAKAFCDRIVAGGYEAMVYGNNSDMARYSASVLGFSTAGEQGAGSKASAKALPVWHAEYNTNSPIVWYDICMWQYSNTGRVKGISGNVDLDILLLDSPQQILTSD